MHDWRRMPRPASSRPWILVRAPLGILRTRPVLLSFAVAGVLLIGSGLGGVWAAGAVVVVVLSYSCGAHASPREGALAVAGLIVAMQVGMGFSEFPNVEISFVTVIPFWVGYQVRLRSSLVSRLAHRTHELRQEQDAFARLSVQRERARIARELHDIVAHHLAVIVVQAGAGRIAAPAPSQHAAERFTTIRQAGGQALAEMTRLVDLLHADDALDHDPAGRWKDLVDQARAGGLEVRIASPLADAQMAGAVAGDAYRIVREALTNAIKHAPGAEVTLHVVQRAERLEIEVHDHGSRNAGGLAATGAGVGLMGMRERIQATGGTLEVGPDSAGGWRLCASLPLASTAVPPTR